MKKHTLHKGYTLIELLIVLAMMGGVLGIAISILGTTLRSSTKSTIFNRVKQNGDLAMETMVRDIQNAVDVCTPNAATLKIYSSNVGNCATTPLTPVTQYTCTVGSVGGPNGGNGYLQKDGANLTTEVKVSACSFSASVANPKRVLIDFSLSQDAALGSASDVATTQQFHTETTLRNF